jgi:hypothetical protein
VRAAILITLALAACAAPKPPPADAPNELPPDATRYFTIWLGGARVGTAVEAETWSPLGVHVERTETMRFLRADTEVELVTTIAIDADVALRAQHVRWTERSTTGNSTGGAATTTRTADAQRPRDAWITSTGTALAPDAIPAELVPLIVRRDGHFAGTVFLPARNFIAGRGRIDAVAPDRLVARLVLGAAPGETTPAEATIDLDRDRMPARIVDGDGVIAIRTTAARARAAFVATDLIAATAIPIAGHRSHRLVLDGDLVLPAVPGQAAATTPNGLAVALGADLPGDLPPGEPGIDTTPQIRALVAAVRLRITPDLGAQASPRDADAATAGDCTTFALAYAALATRRGIPTRVVTGLRVDHAANDASSRLVRHRWAVSWTGRAWIAVDAAFGAAPAGGDLVGLAVHDADDAGLVAGEAALAHVRAATWN